MAGCIHRFVPQSLFFEFKERFFTELQKKTKDGSKATEENNTCTFNYDKTNLLGLPEDSEECGDWKHSQFVRFYSGNKSVERYSKFVGMTLCDSTGRCDFEWARIEV